MIERETDKEEKEGGYKGNVEGKNLKFWNIWKIDIFRGKGRENMYNRNRLRQPTT